MTTETFFEDKRSESEAQHSILLIASMDQTTGLLHTERSGLL